MLKKVDCAGVLDSGGISRPGSAGVVDDGGDTLAKGLLYSFYKIKTSVPDPKLKQRGAAPRHSSCG